MAMQERANRLRSSPDRIREVAGKFTTAQYDRDSFGVSAAHIALQAQHLLTRLDAPRPTIVTLVRNRAPIIRETADESMEAATAGRYADALRTANMLHGYAEVDMEERLGGEAFSLSLNAHRLLMGLVVVRPDVAERLSSEATDVAALVRGAAYAGERVVEYDLLRTAVHTMVLEGMLGDEAMEYWDPFAVVSLS